MSNTYFLTSRIPVHLEEMGTHTWVCSSCFLFLPSFQIIFRNSWEIRIIALDSQGLHLNFGCPLFWLCDLGQLTSPLCASGFLSKLEITVVAASWSYYRLN